MSTTPIGNGQAFILADTLEKARGLSRWYISLLKNIDPYAQIDVNGIKLNSVAWVVAHLTWAENMLVLQGAGGQPVEIDYLKHYGFGSNGETHMEKPDMKMLLDNMKMVHEKAMVHIQSLTDEQIMAHSPVGQMFGDPTIKMAIQHAIRHEGTHAGHLGWLCKLNQIKTV
jgi:hypothetical protein